MQTDQDQKPTAPPSLQLADLLLVLRLIQASSQRGAIRAEEMSEVGAVYNKLVQFLTAAGAIQPATPQEQPKENQNG